MRSGVVVGAVAGVVGGIVGVIFAAVGTSIGLLEAPAGPIVEVVAAMIVLTIIFGAIWGAVYSKFHDLVPGMGVSKGLYFGLLIWLIKDIGAGAYLAFVDRIVPIAIGFVFLGFFMLISYGAVLGVLFRK